MGKPSKYNTEEERVQAKREYNKQRYYANKERFKEYREANAERKREYNKQYREKNAEKLKEYNNEYYKQYRYLNAEKLKEYHKEYYKANAERFKEYKEANAERNREYNREYQRKYYEANTDKIAEQQRQYKKTPMGRACSLVKGYRQMDRKRGFGDVIDYDAKWIVENIFTQKCIYCGKTDWMELGCDRIDNSKPHTKDNVVPCCMKCNAERGTMLFEEFLAKKRGQLLPS